MAEMKTPREVIADGRHEWMLDDSANDFPGYILSALDAAGYVIVPRKLTEAMRDVGPEYPYMDDYVWGKMITAAQKGQEE